ncbi:hypothetical protein ACH5RR_027612 [Cinchona calisaya]|uniref:AT-hook motif nuclear-localized protein n=1 Tax=Cinchona calisaya TaxID=153742 RepID=A0ABD2Z607_9GENT
MSASETGGVITSTSTSIRDTTTFPIQNSPANSLVHNLSFSYPTTDGPNNVFKSPLSASSPPPYPAPPAAADGLLPNNANLISGEAVKRKRGRPRKYGPDGSIAMPLAPPAAAITPPPAPVTTTISPLGGDFSPSSVHQPPSVAAPPPSGTPSSSMKKKARGRPPGSGKRQKVEAFGSAGVGFTPHVITVKAGEDVSAKIMSLSQHGSRTICILSATGAISNVTLRQAATSGGTATYEGRFDILSLSGSFLLSEVGGQRSRTGGLSVSLAGPDGRVLGGCVAGLLIAASPVQVIVGSFTTDGQKEPKTINHTEPLYAPSKVNPSGASGASSPPSRGTLSESSGGPGSPLTHNAGACNNVNSPGMSSMPWKL